MNLKELINTDDLEDLEIVQSDSTIQINAHDLPYVNNVRDYLFTKGVDTAHIKSWCRADNNVIALFKATSKGKTYVVVYDVNEPEYSDNDWACSGTITIDAVVPNRLDARISEFVEKNDMAQIDERIHALIAVIGSASTSNVVGYAAKAIATTVATGDIECGGGTSVKSNQLHFADYMRAHLRDMMTLNLASAGATIVELLRKFDEVDAVMIDMDAEYEHMDDGTFYLSPNYCVQIDGEHHEVEDEIGDFLNAQDLYGDLANSRECEEVTVRIERKALTKLLGGEKISARQVWAVVQETTKAYLAKQAA